MLLSLSDIAKESESVHMKVSKRDEEWEKKKDL